MGICWKAKSLRETIFSMEYGLKGSRNACGASGEKKNICINGIAFDVIISLSLQRLCWGGPRGLGPGRENTKRAGDDEKGLKLAFSDHMIRTEIRTHVK